MRKMATLLILLFMIVTSIHLSAQSNEILDVLLEEDSISLGQAAYLILTAIGRIPEEASPVEAAAVLEGFAEQDWSIPKRSAEEPITLGEYSFLLMQAFDLKGGLMYSIFPGPRYAGRELAYLEIIKGNTSPYRRFSGEEAIGILSRLLDWKEQQS